MTRSHSVSRPVVAGVLLVLASGSAVLADPLLPLEVGKAYVYSRSDNSGNVWTCRMDIAEKVMIGSEDYFRIQSTNYDNDGAVSDEGLVRSTEDVVYGYNPSGPDVVHFQKAPVGTIWQFYDPHEGYDYQVMEIVAIGAVTVPYGAFAESYTRRAFRCVDPGNLSLGQSPYWFETVVSGVGIVKEVDDWNDDPPMIQELVDIIPEPASVALLGLGGLALLWRRQTA